MRKRQSWSWFPLSRTPFSSSARVSSIWETLIREYCKLDVLILGQAVLKHQKLFKDIGTELLREEQLKVIEIIKCDNTFL